MKHISKNFDWQYYHSLIKPILLGAITLLAIWLSIWLVWYLNPTTTSKNAELFDQTEQVMR